MDTTAQPSPLLRLESVSASYGEHRALHSLDLEVHRGESFVLLGESGCGKSTLLKVIAGIVRPTRGTVWLKGHDVTQLDLAERDLNMVFQNYALFPHMTVASNIAFGLRMQGLRHAAVTRRMNDIVRLVGLAGLENRLPAELSGGQQQRVALARALAPSPSLLLLDEPLGALDAVLRQRMQQELRSLQQATGATFVHVTHDQEEALVLADRIGVMRKGQLLQVGSPSEIYERPASLAVAQFFPDSNILRAQPAAQRDHVQIPELGQVCRSKTPVDAGGFVVARPEHLMLEGFSDASDTLQTIGAEAHIEQRLYLGREIRYHVRLARSLRPESGCLATSVLQHTKRTTTPGPPLADVLKVSGTPRDPWRVGDRVRVRLCQETPHIVAAQGEGLSSGSGA